MTVHHARQAWRTLERLARAAAEGSVSRDEMPRALRAAGSARFPVREVTASLAANDLRKACERWCRGAAEVRAALAPELIRLADAVDGHLTAAARRLPPRARGYRRVSGAMNFRRRPVTGERRFASAVAAPWAPGSVQVRRGRRLSDPEAVNRLRPITDGVLVFARRFAAAGWDLTEVAWLFDVAPEDLARAVRVDVSASGARG